MKLFIYTILMMFALAFSIPAQMQNSVKTEPVLRVEVENGKSLDLTAKDLAKFPRREVKAKAHDGKESIYGGYNLSDILFSAGAKIGKDELRGKELGAYLLVEAADGYKATFAIAEITPEFTDKVVLLADTRDGKPLDTKAGAWQIIVPDEKKHGRWVRQVIKLTVKSADNKLGSKLKTNNLADDDLIREIVFRKTLEPRRSNSDKTSKVYYLSIDGGKDPSKNLLKKFADYQVTIKKASELIISVDDSDPVSDSLAKEKGVLFSVSKLDWKSKNEVQVSAGSYIGNLGSDGCTYTLKRENGEWKIVSIKNCFVS